MTRDEVLRSLFGDEQDVAVGVNNVVTGWGRLGDHRIAVVGITDGTPLGVEAALAMAGHVMSVIKTGERLPIVVLVDTASQLMRRRDEMLGLDEYLAHLAKSLIWAAEAGHPTIGILYGSAAAGAFIATALATRHLVALPDAEPSVMDLPSIARVTKQPLDKLKEMAKDTPVFAPGLDHLKTTGAIAEVWDPERDLGDQLAATLRCYKTGPDVRGDAGRENGGRVSAAAVAARVMSEALQA